MSESTNKNLDAQCANIGRKIIDKKIIDKKKDNSSNIKMKNVVQNSLGVLQEDGLYAFYVYLASECENFSNNNNFDIVAKKTIEFLNKDEGLNFFDSDNCDVFQSLQDNILNDLDKTFLTKQTLERILIYARYHAKAQSHSVDKQQEEGENNA